MSRTPDGHGTYHGSNGTNAKIVGNRPVEVRRNNTVIVRPGGGPRTIVSHRPDNRVVVVRGGGHGYVQRPVVVRGRTIVQRTYIVNHVAYVRAYRPFAFRGVTVAFYAPYRYYPAAYHGWVAAPWGAPVDFGWGWDADPWFGYYGPFFRPYRLYPRPSLWMTDFIIGSTLQLAYMRSHAEAEAGEPAPMADQSLEGSAPMSDEVKEMVEAEVRRQLQEAQAEAQNPVREPGPAQSDALPPSFANGAHTFLASDAIEVETTSGAQCQIREGDAIQMNGLPRTGTNAEVRVLASKGSDCAVGSTVMVPVSDLVEMHNNMRENVEKGLETLRERQGTGNLPMLPDAAAAEPMLSPYAEALQPDADAASVIEEEAHQADEIEHEVTAEIGGAGEGNSPVPPIRTAPPVNNVERTKLGTIETGQTESEVIAIMGQPVNISFLGGVKKAYEYRAGKVIFTDGNVSEVDAGAAGSPAPSRSAELNSPAPTNAPSIGMRGNVSIGQSETEVIAVLGQPVRVTFLGGLKKMYEYRDRKVVFVDGAVSDIQQ